MSVERYHNKPFLRVFECYVLFAIGELSEQYGLVMKEMEPKLQEVYDSAGTWLEIVEAQMDLPNDFPEKIRAAWQTHIKDLMQLELPCDPEKFSRDCVDSYLR